MRVSVKLQWFILNHCVRYNKSVDCGGKKRKSWHLVKQIKYQCQYIIFLILESQIPLTSTHGRCVRINTMTKMLTEDPGEPAKALLRYA